MMHETSMHYLGNPMVYNLIKGGVYYEVGDIFHCQYFMENIKDTNTKQPMCD